MTRSAERDLIFWLFLIFVTASAIIEVYVILIGVTNGDFTSSERMIGIINGTFFGVCLVYFLKLVKKTILQKDKDLISEEDLKIHFRDKLGRINAYARINTESDKLFTKDLVEKILVLIERALQDWIGSYHYEISIFADREYPIIIAYYESGGQTTPRSKDARERDRAFYINNHYQVVDLLRNPRPEVIVISRTDEPSARYNYTDQKQRERIKSSVLHCFSAGAPRAIVITCSQPGAFKDSDHRLKNLVQAIGNAMECEYTLCENVYNT